MESGIYKIRNKINGKIYVGSSINIAQRVKYHLTHLRHGKHWNKHLQGAFKKYGETSFVFEVLEEVGRTELLAREQFYINLYNSYNGIVGYNLSPTAKSPLGIIRSDETRKRISAAQKIRKVSDEERIAREHNLLKGRCGCLPNCRCKRHEPETYEERMARGRPSAKKGKTLTELYGDYRAQEIRQKLKDSHIGQRGWNTGLTKYTNRSVAAISAAKMGKPRSAETIRKIALSKTGKTYGSSLKPAIKRLIRVLGTIKELKENEYV